MSNIKDITGQRYGRLVALECTHTKKGEGAFWNCICDCGNTKIVRGGSLQKGSTQSCGCLRNERVKEVNTTHGHGTPGSRTREYDILASMKQRCTNPKNPDYKYYGARGISVCKRWSGEEGYQNFVKDMNKCPEGYSIERINNHGDYEPTNCIWIPIGEQWKNKRKKKKKGDK